MADADAQTAAGIALPASAPPTQGEPCEECGAPLAADQRYCLNCGRRRGGPRVDYRHYMAATQPTEAPASTPDKDPPAGEQPSKPQRDYAPLAAVGGIAVLGVMLLIGVLIGKGGSDQTASTAPPVIRIPAPAGASGSAEEGGPPKDTGGGLKIGGKEKKAKQNDGAGGGSGNAVQASEGDLEDLGSTSGENYVKQSENLPNEIATPGAPPPIDKSTAPGGGEGGAEVIK